MYRSKQENVAVTEEYSALLHEIAKEKGCLLYDWFWASGGRTSILEWKKRKLANLDLVSLKPKGYRLKAEMLGEALLIALNGEATQSLEVEVEAFQQAQSKRLEAFQTLEVATSTTTQEVTTSNTTIRAQSPPTVESGSAVSTSNGSSTSNSSQKITHVVAEGEFLGGIAEQYDVGLSKHGLERFNRRVNTSYESATHSLFRQSNGFLKQLLFILKFFLVVEGDSHSKVWGGIERDCREVQCRPIADYRLEQHYGCGEFTSGPRIDYLSWTKCLHYRRYILRLVLVVEGDSYGKVWRGIERYCREV